LANIKSSKKRIKQNITARLNNMSKKSAMRTCLKNINKNILQQNSSAALLLFDKFQSHVDTLVKHNLIHLNKASRYKTRTFKKICLIQNINSNS
jgi:small subunit ribosomal protein S20